MSKRLLIGLLLGLAILAGLYQLRIALLTTAFNTALAQADVRLLQLQGLEIGWDELNIDQLVLAVGPENSSQTLQGLHLHFSLIDIRPTALSVRRAVLTPLASGEEATPWRLTELVEQLMSGPLESLTVERLEISGFSSAILRPPLSLHASWAGDTLEVTAGERDKTLLLRLQRPTENQLLLSANLSTKSRTVAQLSATIDRQQGQHQVRGTGQLSVDGLLPIVSPLVDGLPAVSGELIFQWSGQLEDDLSQLGQQSWQVQIMPGTVLALQPSDEGAVAVRALQPQLSAQLDFAADGVHLTVAAGELLRAEALHGGDLSVSEPALITRLDWSAHYQFSTGQWRVQMPRAQIHLPRIQMPELNLATSVTLTKLELTRDADGTLDGAVHLDVEALNLQRLADWLPAVAIQGDIALADQTVSFNGQLQSADRKPLLTISAEHQLDTERGKGRLLADRIAFDPADNHLSQYFAYWPFDWDIFEGSVTLDMDVQWRRGDQGMEFNGELNQQLQDLAGVYQDIGFIGLDGDFAARFDSSGQLLTTRPATLSLDSLDVGVPIEAITARFGLDTAQQQLTLESVEARLFGGRVWTRDAVYRVDNAHNSIDIGIDNLQLAQLLALAGYDAIEGTGRISGLLPLDVTAEGVTMARGMLAAKAPGGVFRYRAEVLASTNPAMAQVIKALRNYHFTVFQVEADYMENGDLVLDMVLRGANPDYQGGRPIHLNLNVTDNIPTLLKSLQSGRTIADAISRKLGG